MLATIVLVGLGNPGRKYAGTRHNLGFDVVDALARRHEGAWSAGGRTFDAAEITIGDKRLRLVKPTTYVNRSGRAVAELWHDAEIEPSQLLVIADDIALPIGQLRLRQRGSHGGHNGLRSIIAALQTSDFPRIRLGIGPVPEGVDPADFVLDRFEPSEEPAIADMVARAVSCIEEIAAAGYERAMNLYNATPPARESD